MTKIYLNVAGCQLCGRGAAATSGSSIAAVTKLRDGKGLVLIRLS